MHLLKKYLIVGNTGENLKTVPKGDCLASISINLLDYKVGLYTPKPDT